MMAMRRAVISWLKVVEFESGICVHQDVPWVSMSCEMRVKYIEASKYVLQGVLMKPRSSHVPSSQYDLLQLLNGSRRSLCLLGGSASWF